MVREFPDVLYRLRGPNPEYIKNEIEQLLSINHAFVSPLTLQNDVFEGEPQIIPASDWEIKNFRNSLKKECGADVVSTGTRLQEIAPNQLTDRNTRKQKLREHWKPTTIRKNQHNAYKEMLSKYSIACFTGKEPSQLMWANYADGHKGICFKFELSVKDKNTLQNQPLFNVIYSRERPKIPQIDLLKFGANFKLGKKFTTELTDKEFVTNFLLTKSDEWSGETECRWVDYNETKGNRYIDTTPLKLSEVICGFRAEEETIQACLNAVANKIPVRRCDLAKDSYNFGLNDLN